MKLSRNAHLESALWENRGIHLPTYDWNAVRDKTLEAPIWVHFGAGNIFRGYIAALQDRLLSRGLSDRGIIAAESFDPEIIEKVYLPFNSMSLTVTLCANGQLRKEVVASIADGLCADGSAAGDMERLERAFCSDSLQIVSFTVTEKGYILHDGSGTWLPEVTSDLENGPDGCKNVIFLVTRLLYLRYCAGGKPLAMLSLDNCSANGEKLRRSVLAAATEWYVRGFLPEAFIRWLSCEKNVAFPLSMIDKITPRPDPAISALLAEDGVENMEALITGRRTYIAPFVNTEAPQYLVIEDRFPNGRPPLEQAGVYMTDANTVNLAERMKVTTCLNPLHTALAVFGCLLEYQKIADEMDDPLLSELVRRIGFNEGLRVVTDPGILSPEAFLHEVLEQRLTNRFLPDTPQRIATDTSQKVPIRFGQTIRAYAARDDLDVTDLTYIPLAIAGWLRYLLAVNDRGEAMHCSSDPRLEELQNLLCLVRFDNPNSIGSVPEPILRDCSLWGCDLVALGLGEKIMEMLAQMCQGVGAVRNTLKCYLVN